MCNDECLLLKMNIMQKYLSLPFVCDCSTQGHEWAREDNSSLSVVVVCRCNMSSGFLSSKRL